MVTARASLKAEATTREAAARPCVCGGVLYEPLFRRLHDCEFELLSIPPAASGVRPDSNRLDMREHSLHNDCAAQW